MNRTQLTRLIVAVVIALTLATVGAQSGHAGAASGGAGLDHDGSIRELVLRSKVLDEERVLLVRLPKGYDQGDSRYPVLFVLDAEWHFNLASADVELLSECSYIKPHPIPQMIVVGLVNIDRNRDFTPTHVARMRNMKFPTSGGADRFRRFLVEEVLPKIDREFRTHPYRILAGWSLGGLFTIDTLLNDPGPFGAFLAISPSLWWDDERSLRQLADPSNPIAFDRAKKLVVTLGSKEQETMVARATNGLAQHLRANPRPDLVFEQVPIEGFGHNLSPKTAFFFGLATIFGDLNPPADAVRPGLEAIDGYFRDLSSRYRFSVPIPEGLYGSVGWNLVEAGRTPEAEEVFRAWVERHPQSSVAVASLGSFRRESGDTDAAHDLLLRAIELEKQESHPRQDFILDLKRDVEALETEMEGNPDSPDA